MSAQHLRTPDAHRPGTLRTGLRLLAATLGLLTVLTVPPALLLTLTGSPLDPPALLRSPQALTAHVDDTTLLWLLALLGWLLWLHLLGSLVVEALQQTRGSRLRMPLPGLLFGANTLLASHLIGALLLTTQALPAPGLTPATPHPRTASISPIVAAATSSSALGETADTTALTTMPGDARHHWQRTLTSPAPPFVTEVAAGVECRVLPPHGRHHDTLWDVAERHLGDGTRWREVFALNQHRLMPDGQRLTRASLIRPGWSLRLPADARVLDVDRIENGATPHPSAQPNAPIQPDAMGHHDGAAAEPGESKRPNDSPLLAEEPDSDLPTDTAEATVPDASSVEPTAVRREAPQPATPAVSPNPTGQAPDSGDSPPAPAALPATVGVLALGALAMLTALTRRRKVAARRRPAGVRPARPTPDLLAAEQRLRTAARDAEDVAATVRLALLAAADQLPRPRILAVWHHADGGIELVLTGHEPSQAAPAPFVPTLRGWLLPPAGQRYLFTTRTDSRRPDKAARLAQHLHASTDPCPALLPVGTQDDSAVLVNLEAFGLISLTRTDFDAGAGPTDGPTEGRADELEPTSREILAAWVRALAGAPWAELTRVTVPPDWAPLTTGLERVTALGPRTRAGDPAPQPLPPEDRAALRDHDSLADARHADTGPARYLTVEVTVGFPVAELPAWLPNAAADPLDPNLLLLPHPHPAAHPWRLHHDGTLSIPGVAEHVQPLRIDPAEHAVLLRLLEHAQDPPHADPTHPHPARTEQAGPSALPDDAPALPRVIDLTAHDSPGPAGPGAQPDNAPGSDQAAEDWTGAAAEGAPVLPPASLPHGLGAATPTAMPTFAVLSIDGEVAADDPQAELPPGPVEVAILGPLQVTGVDVSRLRPPALEMLVYLALHRQPITLDALADAVWSGRPVNERSIQTRISELRRLLTTRLERISGARWQLTDLVVTDWQRFRALADGNPAQQLAALALVRGTPFAQMRLDWYQLEGHFGEIEASIVDLALAVGQRALKAGEYETARTAALAGLRGCPYDERLYRIAMHAADARGATGELRQLRHQLALVLDEEIEPDDTLQPATEQLYDQLLGSGERRGPAERRR